MCLAFGSKPAATQTAFRESIHKPEILPAEQGLRHPPTALSEVLPIFARGPVEVSKETRRKLTIGAVVVDSLIPNFEDKNIQEFSAVSLMF